jgi:D-arabinose 1-dehydrogenase-like Zn-dependent alcohol dehydrogenase
VLQGTFPYERMCVLGERVAVVGGGGSLAVQLLHLVVPAELLVIEPDERRAHIAGRIGATERFNRRRLRI